MDALVSVVLPFRNSPFLARAIQSILDQTYANFELLLINNNSDAESAAVAKSYEGRDHRIKYLHEARAGVAHAMNRGIQEASGNYIARMDADDYSFPNRLENQVAMLERNPVLSAVAGKVEYEGEKENRGFQLFVDWQNQLVAEQDIYNSQFVELPLVNPTLMFRSEVFKDRLYRQGDFPEDYEFFLYLMSIDVCVGKSPECVLKWTDSSNRLSRTDVRYSRDAFYLCKTPYLVEWLKKNNPFFPKVWIWGGGKVARKYASLLTKYDIVLECFVDLETGENQVDYRELPSPGSCFILSYVGSRGARAKIRDHLKNRGYVELKDFLMVA